MNSGVGLSDVEKGFCLFGDKARFALEMRLLPEPRDGAVPADSAGSWGEWKLWVSHINLCNLQVETSKGLIGLSQVRWFLAPLFRWIAANWAPLLHETRLPPGGQWGDRRPRWARLAYLSVLESTGDNFEKFDAWQNWATRHAIRTAAEGGIVPDVFFQRIGDDIEISWGDRIQPGAEAASFVAEDGVARVSVDELAIALSGAMRWFLEQQSVMKTAWGSALADVWRRAERGPIGAQALSWYLDARPEPGSLTQSLTRALGQLHRPAPKPDASWWGTLAPEVAMFGDLSPQISADAARTLLFEYFDAQTSAAETPALATLVQDEPAWRAASPWDNGYALALDVLDQADPDRDAPATLIERMLEHLDIRTRNVSLGDNGPRGVALAGARVQATILVNNDHPANTSPGRRFTLAHELCHILFDRERARPLTHSSTPWASAPIEQRANAFAAMLLMPPQRARRPENNVGMGLKAAIDRLARRLGVSGTALKQHLANLGEITPAERDTLMGRSAAMLG